MGRASSPCRERAAPRSGRKSVRWRGWEPAQDFPQRVPHPCHVRLECRDVGFEPRDHPGVGVLDLLYFRQLAPEVTYLALDVTYLGAQVAHLGAQVTLALDQGVNLPRTCPGLQARDVCLQLAHPFFDGRHAGIVRTPSDRIAARGRGPQELASNRSPCPWPRRAQDRLP